MAIESAEMLSPDYILPDTNVTICRGVQLDQNYYDTIYWRVGIDTDGTEIPAETIEQARERQFNWFNQTANGKKYTLQALTYQREGRKYLRVEKTYADLIDCNYLVFKNRGNISTDSVIPHYENKYFYCFITKLEYLNDNVTIIHYAVDLLQTYIFDASPGICFIERQHSENDIPEENLIEENIETGEYLDQQIANSSLDWAGWYNNWNEWPYMLLVVATVVPVFHDDDSITFSRSSGALINGQWNGCAYYSLEESEIYRFFSALTSTENGDLSNAIIALYTLPKAWAQMFDWSGGTLFYNRNAWESSFFFSSPRIWSYSYQKDGILKTGPRNRKLYNYPYNYLLATSSDGDIKTYRYEFFNNSVSNRIVFNAEGNLPGKPELRFIPENYKNVKNNYLESISVTNFPMSTFNVDAYKAWLAQNNNRNNAFYLTNGLSMASGVLSGFTLGGVIGNNIMRSSVVSGFNNIFNHMAMLKDIEKYPPELKGKQEGNIDIAAFRFGLNIWSRRITDEYAAIIDDYFDKFGYALNLLAIPNRAARKKWTYVKTRNCVIEGNIPQDVKSKIEELYDNGIRWWLNPSYIGNYSLDNTVDNNILPTITSFAISSNNITMSPGDIVRLTATTTGYYESTSIGYTSDVALWKSNVAEVEVTSYGAVIASEGIAPGSTAIITATCPDDPSFTATCNVTIL